MKSFQLSVSLLSRSCAFPIDVGVAFDVGYQRAGNKENIFLFFPHSLHPNFGQKLALPNQDMNLSHAPGTEKKSLRYMMFLVHIPIQQCPKIRIWKHIQNY